MKKIIIVLLSVITAALLSFSVLSLQSNSEIIISADSISANPGDEVTVNLSLKNNTGFSALGLGIIYDKDNLELNGIQNKIPSFNMKFYKSLLLDGDENFYGNGIILSLTFKIAENAEPGNYIIKINFLDASTKSGDFVDMKTENGKIKVEDVLKGDVNGDGKINVSDCVCIKMYLAGDINLTDTQIALADVTGDGSVNKEDYEKIAKYAVGMIQSF